jgi:NADH dehydrogenase/NADH:ubiquinone oxidoreductase subunit G
MISFTIHEYKQTVEAQEIKTHSLEAPHGTTVLEAADEFGIEIPRLCFVKGLEKYGGCRVCLIEVEMGGRRRLTAACTTEITDGMVAYVNTPEVINKRAWVIELLLAKHPLDCPFCDRAGDCRLQEIAFKYGSTRNRYRKFYEIKPSESTINDPLINVNLNRCILCTTCVRVCQKDGNSVLGISERGPKLKISAPNNALLMCKRCGSCTTACPVGAMTNKKYGSHKRVL